MAINTEKYEELIENQLKPSLQQTITSATETREEILEYDLFEKQLADICSYFPNDYQTMVVGGLVY